MTRPIFALAAPLAALAALAAAPAPAAAQDRLDYYAVPDAKCTGEYRYGKYYEHCAYDAALDRDRYGYGEPRRKKPHGHGHRPSPAPAVISDPNHVLVEPGGTQSIGAFGDLQAAIAYAIDGGRIVVKPGTYYLDQPLDIDKSLTIEGLGPYGSIIIQPRGAACLAFNPPTRTNAPALFISNVRFAPRGGAERPRARPVQPVLAGGPSGFVSGGLITPSSESAPGTSTSPCIEIRQGFVRLENVEMDLRTSHGGGVRLIEGDLEVSGAVLVGPAETGYAYPETLPVRPSEIIERSPCDWGGYGVCVAGGDASVKESEIAGFPVGLRAKSNTVVEETLFQRNGVGLDIAQTGDRFAASPGVVLLDSTLQLNDVGLLLRSSYPGDIRASSYVLTNNRVAGLYVGAPPSGRCEFSSSARITYNGRRPALLWSVGELAGWARNQDRSYAAPYGSDNIWTTRGAAYDCRIPVY